MATANVAANGSYTFSNVANGTYTLQPSEPGFTFNPTTESVTVNGNTVTAPAFTATATATTGSINGTISQTGTISGATVQLLQGTTLMATANVAANGSYSFSNVANGTYTLQPIESGFTFSPVTQNVTVNGNTVTAQVFNASPAGSTAVKHVQSCTPTSVGGFGIPTFTTITCNNVGANMLVVGVAYECCNHLSDMTVSDGRNTFAATPAGQPNPGTSVPSCFANGGNQVASVFYHSYTSAPGSITINVSLQANESITAFADEFSGISVFDKDACGTANSGTSINTPSLTPSGANEIQYAICAAGGGIPVGGTAPWTQDMVTSGNDAEWLITGGANAQTPVFGTLSGGTGWACVNAAFKGSGGGTGPNGTITGTISPAPASGSVATIVLSQNGTTVASTTVGTNGSYTFSNVANGTYTLQPSESGFTFSPTTASVTVNGNTVTAPTFTGTATTGTIKGTISQTGTVSGATVQLLQGTTLIATASVAANGSYSFSNVANGTYTLQPSESGFTFSPTTASVTVNGNTVTAPAFTATPNAQNFNVSGTINPAQAGTGTTVTLSQNGTTVATTSANSSGTYIFTNIANGTYTVTPANTGFTFNPASQPVTVSGGNATVSVFNATAAAIFPVTGTITPAAAGIGTTVTLSQNGTMVATAQATAAGIYNFANIANGTYSVTPTNNAYTFSPTTQSVTVRGTGATVASFNALSNIPLLFPDLQDILPPGKMSIVQTSSGRQFQYTHDTLNAGPGPLVIQPVFNAASGSYQGTQYIYSQNSGGTWSLVQQLPVGGAFIFDSDHGHFHFPLVTYGLYTVAADGGPGTPVALSAKVSFCINDSFLFLPNIPNAGQLGNLGSCNDPTSLRGLDIGDVDEYDQTDAGQSISINNLPDGTYWLRAIDDPNNFLFEADKTNNETDVELTISGNTLTVLKTVVPVINNPPSISLTSPSNGSTVSKTVQLTASTTTVTGVRYLVDGQPFGGVATTPPYSVSWNTTTVPDGTHWIAAQTTDSTGVTGTSPVTLVTVNNAAVTGPTVQLTSPANGSIVSATISMYVQVGSSLPIQSVSFFVDFVQIGSALTAPPYIISWNTTTVLDGSHTVTVSATDSQGNVGNSTPVTLSVDNSHPANLIGKDVTVSADGHDAITTPVFSTSVASDLLVAFVSYDGPGTGAQTASVSGAGLNWTLLERSNTQFGTAEIWSARADGLLSGVTVTASETAGTGYHGSLTVIAFTNAAGTSVVGRTGALTGAPDIPLPGVIAGDWVYAVGNDWDNAIARVPVSGQVLVHQKVDTVVGDTYWVQSTTAPSVANALVDIHDSSPTTGRWNYAAVEIVATHQ
jgi:hypothetical protein